MAWTTLSLEVTTPVFNGGADPAGKEGFRPDPESGIRVASIRGAMRFWFRALAGCLTGPDIGLLASLEQRVFGSTENTSPVRLRIPAQPGIVLPSGRHKFLQAPQAQGGRWIIYLMGQGLGDLRNRAVLRPYVEPGQEFELKIGFRHPRGGDPDAAAAVENLALASLWLTCAYGGIGARVRRGFGGLRITGADGPLPGPWASPGAVVTPGLDHYENLTCLWPQGPAGSCMRSLILLAGRPFSPSAWADVPGFPVLSKTHAPAMTSGGDAFLSWEATLAHAGEQLRHFRANRENRSGRYQPSIETREWTQVIHGPSDDYTVGALGLPVVYRDSTVNADRADSDRPLRRASPLWLRAVGSQRDWRVLSFAFRAEFLPGPDAPGVHLWSAGNRNRQLHVTDADVANLTDRWITALHDDLSFASGQASRP
jgi:CRISPR-associated protein Cmr1